MKLILALAILLAVTACNSQSKSQVTTPLIVGRWTIESIGGTPVQEGTDAHLVFHADSTLSGNATCNGLSGSFRARKNSLTFSGIATI